MNKDEFKTKVSSKQSDEILIPFVDLDLHLEPYVKTDEENSERRLAITNKQNELADWCREIPGCNWSVGYIDDEERNVMVVKWWFQGWPGNPMPETAE